MKFRAVFLPAEESTFRQKRSISDFRAKIIAAGRGGRVIFQTTSSILASGFRRKIN
jgi:hypothetical protein